MKMKKVGLVHLLNLNGGISPGTSFHEPYQFEHLIKKERGILSEDLLGLGDFVVEKLKRLRTLHASLKNIGASPFLDKLLKKGMGKIFSS